MPCDTLLAVADVLPPPQAAPPLQDWNRDLSALGSFVTFCRHRGWPVQDLVAGLDRRREKADNTRVLTFLELERLWSRESVGLPDRLRPVAAAADRWPPARPALPGRSAPDPFTDAGGRGPLPGDGPRSALLPVLPEFAGVQLLIAGNHP